MSNKHISKISLPPFVEKLVPQSQSLKNWDWSALLALMAIFNWNGTNVNGKENNSAQ